MKILKGHINPQNIIHISNLSVNAWNELSNGLHVDLW